MSIEVRPCASVEELRAALRPIIHYFGAHPSDEDLERIQKILPIERMHAAFEGEAIVGGAGAYTFEMTVPGGTVPAAGVTVVGVLPTHRRRGIQRAMMQTQLEDVHRRGEPVAYLWASEETIYGRYGYGLASFCGEIDLPKAASAFARSFEPRGQARILSEEEALAPISEVYDRVRRDFPGMFARTEAWWRARRLADPESRRHGAGVLNRVVLYLDGRPEAYALYRVNQRFEAGNTAGHVDVVEAIGTSLQATREIWRLVLDVDWVDRVKAYQLPLDHPLFFLLARPRSMRFRVGDALWVRLVDLPGALAARRLGPGDPVVIEVEDPLCAWNTGRYEVGAGGVERTTRAAGIALGIDALGSVYLGGFSFAQLARAGRIEELRPGAVEQADALFRHDRLPWCPEIF